MKNLCEISQSRSSDALAWELQSAFVARGEPGAVGIERRYRQ
jgi:hypothetical protein